MVTLKWVRFRSTLFKAEPEEEEEVNPGKCGKQLAQWISERLKSKGFPSENIYPEDWGYEISLSAEKHSKFIGCQNDGESIDRWACSVEVSQGIIGRILRKINVEGELLRLQSAVTEILEAEPGISEIRWED